MEKFCLYVKRKKPCELAFDNIPLLQKFPDSQSPFVVQFSIVVWCPRDPNELIPLVNRIIHKFPALKSLTLRIFVQKSITIDYQISNRFLAINGSDKLASYYLKFKTFGNESKVLLKQHGQIKMRIRAGKGH